MENAQAKYTALQNQLNPHFLFNSLNTLIAEIKYNPDNAVSFTQNLSSVYRYVLQCQDRNLMTVKEELAFMNAYLFLHKVRLGIGLRNLSNHCRLLSEKEMIILQETAVFTVKSAVIFTTAYDQYAIRAFSVNSIDYILKPVDEQRLSEAIAKYESLHQQAWLQSEKYMETLLEALKHPERRYRSRFLISGVNEFWSLRVEEQLDPEQFFRVNRQMILNVDAIDRAIPYFKGRIKVIVHPPFKTDILISEGKASAFRLWLNY